MSFRHRNYGSFGQPCLDFEQAVMQANEVVRTALRRYCARYEYTGSGVVGERPALMGFPDHICAAVENICEIADETDCNPESVPVKGSVSVEHLAAFLGWQKVLAVPRDLRLHAWTDGKVWLVPPQQIARAKAAGIFASLPRPGYSFRSPPEARIDVGQPRDHADQRTQGTRRAKEDCAKWRPNRQIHILSREQQSALPLGTANWVAFGIGGMPAEIRSTNGDGLGLGVAVDSGRIIRVRWQKGCEQLHLMNRFAKMSHAA
jgi:hypothetical protein